MHPLMPVVFGCVWAVLAVFNYHTAAVTVLFGSFDVGLFLIVFNAARLYYRPFDLAVTPLVGELTWMQGVRQGAKYMGLSVGGFVGYTIIAPAASFYMDTVALNHAIYNVDRINEGLKIDPLQRKLEIQQELYNLRQQRSLFPKIQSPSAAAELLKELKELRDNHNAQK